MLRVWISSHILLLVGVRHGERVCGGEIPHEISDVHESDETELHGIDNGVGHGVIMMCFDPYLGAH